MPLAELAYRIVGVVVRRECRVTVRERRVTVREREVGQVGDEFARPAVGQHRIRDLENRDPATSRVGSPPSRSSVRTIPCR